MAAKTKVTFTTSLPSPYQVELFDALASGGVFDIRVIYCSRRAPNRAWESPLISHEHYILNEISISRATEIMEDSDLVVFSGYHPRTVRTLISQRVSGTKPWAFWGERPGYHLPFWLGRYYRSFIFPQLRDTRASIWGIGNWAVEAYRREHGEGHAYLNVPYYSRLDRYLAVDRSQAIGAPRRILFSGRLIKRKGVDLLIRAFIALAQELPELELSLVGDGPLRGELEQLSLAVSGRVHFLGFKQWDELPAYYANADILCAPSRYDGWGLIVPEGLAAGLMVISTDLTGSARDLLDDVGWVVPARKLEPLINGLRSATLVSSEERLRKVNQGRARALNFSIAAGVERVTEAILQSITYAESPTA